MTEANTAYLAVHAVSPGKLEMTEKPLIDPPADHVRIRVEACGSVTRMQPPSKGRCRSSGRVYRAMKPPAGSMLWMASRAGLSVSASVSTFSAAAAATARPAAAAIS